MKKKHFSFLFYNRFMIIV